jgi:hypothetical protein
VVEYRCLEFHLAWFFIHSWRFKIGGERPYSHYHRHFSHNFASDYLSRVVFHAVEVILSMSPSSLGRWLSEAPLFRSESVRVTFYRTRSLDRGLLDPGS